MAELEKAILNGTFAQGPDPDAEPVRAPSPTLSAGGRSDEDEDGNNNNKSESVQRGDLASTLLTPEEADARYSSVWSRQQASHSTGPKGVLSDFRASTYDSQQLPVEFEKFGLSSDAVGGHDGGAESGVEAWRRKRLEELKSSRIGGGGAAWSRGEEDQYSEGRFGRLREIGISNFESAVLEEDPAVKVILLVYEPHIAACGVLSQHLSSLAREHPEAKFLRAKASELDFATQDAEVVLPTLLIYQAGELIGNLVAVDLEWERSLDYESEQVEDVLQRHGAISRARGF